MGLIDYFRSSKNASAATAKERLQILVAQQRTHRDQPSYIPKMQQELLEVIRKYVHVEQEAITINFEQDDNQEVLELNIVLPDEHRKN